MSGNFCSSYGESSLNIDLSHIYILMEILPSFAAVCPAQPVIINANITHASSRLKIFFSLIQFSF